MQATGRNERVVAAVAAVEMAGTRARSCSPGPDGYAQTVVAREPVTYSAPSRIRPESSPSRDVSAYSAQSPERNRQSFPRHSALGAAAAAAETFAESASVERSQ